MAPCEGRGPVSLVGAGPGDRGLLTVRGRERLLAADAIVCDRLAVTTLPCDLPASVELHWVGKEAGHHPVPQDEINALLVRLAREGKRVVRLKGGDPYVFGRGGEEALALSEAGVAFEVIPGVTAGVAVAAYAGVPVTHRHEAARVTFVTAHEAIRSSRCSVRWDLLAADPHATLVGYMGVTSLPDVVERLLAAGMDPATPAAMVERGTTSRQRVVTCTLSGLVDGVRREHLDAPALFVIGPTVRYATSRATASSVSVRPSCSYTGNSAARRSYARIDFQSSFSVATSSIDSGADASRAGQGGRREATRSQGRSGRRLRDPLVDPGPGDETATAWPLDHQTERPRFGSRATPGAYSSSHLMNGFLRPTMAFTISSTRPP
ncbi:MAG: uroporphyrinogen-III C-methyltransferase [Candidatus Riflebacteria bacterium]|nr:uroporphyrinogen-III C-methyltransferase [Candidatus Riflebacteria bacterium]